MTRALKAFALAAMLAASPVLAKETLPPAGNPDTAQIVTLVSSIPLAVDRAAYALAQDAFAPKVIVDYTSLWGGEPNEMTPAELMTAWRGIVPGFDATWHELGEVSVTLNGDTATATAFVDGRHWIGEELWRPMGTYVWDLQTIDGAWKVTRMVFDMTHEVGNRGLAMQATQRAQALAAAAGE